MKQQNFDINTEKAKMKIKAVANMVNNNSLTPVLAKLRLDKNLVKRVIKENGYGFYETKLKDINKKEINESGKESFPIIDFINSSNKTKFIFIDFNPEEEKIKKEQVELIADAVIYSEINGQPILSNTLFVLNDDLIKTLEEYSEKKNSTKIKLVLETLITV